MNDILFALMFFRLFYVSKAFFNYTIYKDGLSRKICKYHGIKPNAGFAFKCLLVNKPV